MSLWDSITQGASQVVNSVSSGAKQTWDTATGYASDWVNRQVSDALPAQPSRPEFGGVRGSLPGGGGGGSLGDLGGDSEPNFGGQPTPPEATEPTNAPRPTGPAIPWRMVGLGAVGLVGVVGLVAAMRG